ncbi:meiotic recombination protein SPO11 [Nematocida minor]|uniref:meiotic recombination protein SPO11 n=1 Tax=Nematocida minor TaxID=1912983 RepID=UPI002220025E|nr:meiotic recombination protein SPO11 [Nematocida minor]KAI5192469.1 meiotic recombination protein SPO11 [Nematocida minor]
MENNYPISISEIARTLKDREAFLLKYSKCLYARVIYEDILTLLHEILVKKVSVGCAVKILNVYYVVLHEPKQITVREMFYRCKKIFSHQKHLVATIQNVYARLKTELNIVASYKGLVHGECAIKREKTKIVLAETSLIPYIRPFDRLVTSAKIIIVVEKEAVFNDVLQDKTKIEEKLGASVLIVTGKGYPCTNTLLFLMLAGDLRIFGLFDCDPHGLSIYTVYKYGSRHRPYLKVPSIQRIGVFLQDLPSLADLASIQQKKEYSMIRNLSVQHKEMEEEIRTMMRTGKKASIEDIAQIKTIKAYVVDQIFSEYPSLNW